MFAVTGEERRLGGECECAVLVPLYRNAATVAELAERVTAAMDEAGGTFRLVFIVDASPDDCWDRVVALAQGNTRISGLLLRKNVGQHRALLEGFRSVRACCVAVMDGDLQDPPELLPRLFAACRCQEVTVFARRLGYYQDMQRMISSRVYKWILGTLVDLPVDVGTFFVVPQETALAMGRVNTRHLSMVALARLYSPGWGSVEYPRRWRQEGRSSYSFLGRLRCAVSGLLCVLECRLGLRGGQCAAEVAARVNL